MKAGNTTVDNLNKVLRYERFRHEVHAPERISPLH